MEGGILDVETDEQSLLVIPKLLRESKCKISLKL